MLARVETVPGQPCEVYAADKRHAIVDQDELLVVAVQRPLARVERAADLRPAGQLVTDSAHVGTTGSEKRKRGAGP